MKKQYINPKVRILKLKPSSIICVSTGFGDGDTNVMHAKEQTSFSEDDYLWIESME